MSGGEADLRAVLEMLDPATPEALRRVLIHDQADRDAIASLSCSATATDMATTGPTSSTC